MHRTTILQTDLIPVSDPHGREFSDTGWLRCIKRWLWQKWSKPYFPDRAAYRIVEIQHDEVIPLICEAINSLSCVNVWDIECVIVGPEQCRLAMGEIRSGGYGFSVEVGADLHVYHVPVRVVPWFDGVLVVPKRRK